MGKEIWYTEAEHLDFLHGLIRFIREHSIRSYPGPPGRHSELVRIRTRAHGETRRDLLGSTAHGFRE